MKRFFLRQLSPVLVIAILLSLTGMAEDGIVWSDDAEVGEIAMGDESLLLEGEISPEDIGDTLLLDEIPFDGIEVEEPDIIGTTVPEETTAPEDDVSLDGEEPSNTGTNAQNGVPQKLTLGVQMTYALDTSKLAKGKAVTYESSKAKVAKVSKKGVVTAVKKGSATITCYVGKKKIAACKVTVVPAPSKVKLPWKTLDIGKKESVQLAPVIKDGTMASFTYATKDKKIASVSAKGVVKGIKVGKKTTITVTTQNKKKVNLTVNVLNAPKKVTLDQKKAAMTVGDTVQLKATLPNKTASQLTWKSGNKKVATVDENGLITAVGAGTAKITVSTFNKKKAKCTVTVREAESDDGFIIEFGAVVGYIGPGGDIQIPDADAEGNAVFAIGEGAFKGNEEITSVIIPQGVVTVGESAFEGCKMLQSVHIPNSVEDIGSASFNNCGKLREMKAY